MLVLVFSLVAIVFTGCTSDDTSTYKDGTYSAVAEEPNMGWLPQVTVVIKEGKIEEIDYREVAVEASEGIEEGDLKSPDNYENQTPFEVMEKVEKLVIDNNGTEDLEVDGITGATSTRTTMLELIDEALRKAK